MDHAAIFREKHRQVAVHILARHLLARLVGDEGDELVFLDFPVLVCVDPFHDLLHLRTIQFHTELTEPELHFLLINVPEEEEPGRGRHVCMCVCVCECGRGGSK